MKNSFTFILLFPALIGCSLFLTSCNDVKKQEEVGIIERNMNSSASYIRIKPEDGSEINLKLPEQSGGRSLPNRFYASLSENGIVVLLQLISAKDPIEEKKYEDVGVTIKNLNGEEYRSYYFKNKKTTEEGQAETIITSIDGENVHGNFKGILYSKTGNKAFIEGEFSVHGK